ncbi:MAG: radical SAM protein [Desulfobulbaceae bacterium]|nr:radical SAM protein [Desulfobulbaceae bacterium]
MPIVAQHVHAQGLLQKRVQAARRLLSPCTLCPRQCRVDRLAGEKGFCATASQACIASYGPHFGEESPLVGKNGSGTIFVAGCNLGCCFCQNKDISRDTDTAQAVDARDFAAIMLELQARGCANINVVTPSHVAPQLLEALLVAVEAGLDIPLVYNCGGYESLATLELLAGCVDIYMPDMKFWSAVTAQRYANASDYPERMREAVICMHQQVGELMLDEQGRARSGLLVRHLLMPDMLAETKEILRFIAEQISPSTYVNIMAQYRPCGDSAGCAELQRSIGAQEYREALNFAKQIGLSRLDEPDMDRLFRLLFK